MTVLEAAVDRLARCDDRRFWGSDWRHLLGERDGVCGASPRPQGSLAARRNSELILLIAPRPARNGTLFPRRSTVVSRTTGA